MKGIKAFLFSILNLYPQWINKREYKNNPYTFNERPVEYGFVFRQISRLYPAKVLDVGTGTTALPHMMRNCGLKVTAIDNIKDYWPVGMFNRHYYVIDDDITATNISDTFDLITCISVLEHIENYKDAVKNMFSLLKSGGHLILTFPYTEHEYVENVYELPGSNVKGFSPYQTHSFSRADLDNWFEKNGGNILEQEYWRFWDEKYWTVGNKLIPPKQVEVGERHQMTCLLVQKSTTV